MINLTDGQQVILKTYYANGMLRPVSDWKLVTVTVIDGKMHLQDDTGCFWDEWLKSTKDIILN